MSGLLARDLVVVTGKGGAGKTTVAAALALAAARRGREVLVCELAGQARLAHILGGAPPAGVSWVTIDPQAALEEWLRRQVGAGPVRVLRHSPAFHYFVAAAPGAAELVTIGEIVDLAQAGGRLVILDAPATGHALALLAAPRTYGEIAPLGHIARQSAGLREFLADPVRTGYLAVALPEAMSVEEVLDLEARLPAAAGRGLDAIVVDAVHPDRFSNADARRMEALARRGVSAGLLGLVLAEYRRAHRQAAEVARLRARARAPVLVLPFVFPPAGEAAVCRRLAGSLARLGEPAARALSQTAA